MDNLIITNNQTEGIVQEPIKSSKANIILDATILSSLMSCARMIDFHFNHNLVSINGKSNSLESGSIIHKILEVYYRNKINGFDRNTSLNAAYTAGEMYYKGCIHCKDFIPIYDDSTRQIILSKPSCGHSINEYPSTSNVPTKSEGYLIGYDHIISTAEQYFEFYKNDSWIPLEVEVVKGKILYEDDEIRILWKAKLDLTVDTNQGIYPIDHKTMKQNRQSVKMNNQFIGQCIIMNTRTVIIDKIGFQKTLEPKEKFIRSPFSYSYDMITEWQEHILPYYAKLLLMYNETGYWPPNYTHCENKYGLCSFNEVCASDRGMREEEIKMKFIVGKEWNPENVED